MADILIRMEMPKNCGKCFVGDRTICADGCVLIELPEHGDLIDRDKLVESKYVNNVGILVTIVEAPVIVPSNKEETE